MQGAATLVRARQARRRGRAFGQVPGRPEPAGVNLASFHPTMRFGYTILYVRDVAASVDLYERAFGQRRRFVHESGEYAELDTGSTTLSLASHELAESNLPGAFRLPAGDAAATPFEVCFVTDDVAGAY